MRQFETNGDLSVHAIAGTYVVMLGLDATAEARKGLLGFTIKRKGGGGRAITLGGGLTFKGISAETTETATGPATPDTAAPEDTPPAPPTRSVRSDKAPLQAFLWSDYTALPGTTYTYEVVPVYGTPGAMEPRASVSVTVATEDPDDGVHGVFFNRGVAGSQAYARKFGDYRRSYRSGTSWQSFIKPEDVPDREAYQWLSRGLEEGLIAFLQQADGPRYKIRASVYEFSYLPVLREFVAAMERGADVKVVHHCKNQTTYALKSAKGGNVVVQAPPNGDQPPAADVAYKDRTIVKGSVFDSVGDATNRAVLATGIQNPGGLADRSMEQAFDRMLIARTHPAISHNKFIVLLDGDTPVQVWTGSTNVTDGGIFGQSNVGHAIRDEATAAAYYAYWQQLATDPANKAIKTWTVTQGAPLDGDDPAPPGAITPVFSPRATEDVLDWYATQIGRAVHSVHLTSAFTISDPFLQRLTDGATPDDDPDTPYLRYVLLEGIGGLLRDKAPKIQAVPLNRVAWGETLKARGGKEELIESLTGLNGHVNYLHTKYMLIDPLTDDPLVITGSANFSSASTTANDENMVVIRGDTRVADIFLGEFMRLFNHYRIRNELNRLDDVAYEATRYLADDDSWTDPYYDAGSELYQERKLFCQPPPPKPALDLKYYMLDWDDNILFMPTQIRLVKDGKAVAVTTKEYATIRKDPTYAFPDGDPDKAFAEFRDGTGDFVGDVEKAIRKKAFAPSYRAFKRALCEARLFAIVTARGHSPATLRQGVERFIALALTDEERTEMVQNIQRYNRMAGVDVADEVGLDDYLGLNGYIGVSSPEFLKAYQEGDPEGATAASPEEAKTFAVHQFVEKAVELANALPAESRQIAFGFSDDDLGNLDAMRSYIQHELVQSFDTVRFFVYDTSGDRAHAEAL